MERGRYAAAVEWIVAMYHASNRSAEADEWRPTVTALEIDKNENRTSSPNPTKENSP